MKIPGFDVPNQIDRLKGHRLKAGVRNSKHFSLNPFSLNTFI
jgi:hypothetical protein